MPAVDNGRHRAARSRHAGRRLLVAGLALAAVALIAVGAAVAGAEGDGEAESKPTTRSDRQAHVSQPTLPASTSLQAPVDPTASSASAGVPVQVTLARLGIDSTLDRVGLTSDGRLRRPPTFGKAAWFDRGVRPGDVGPAIIVGHVDSRSGPAVFFALQRARNGDSIAVRDSQGASRTFVVTAVRRYPKAAFGTAEVYGPTTQPQLRLITCTGVFDSAARSYRDNLVVFATLREARAG